MKDSTEKDSLPQEGRKKWLSVKGLGWRIFMGLTFTIILTVFLQMREVRVEMVETDSISKQYVVAQIDFEFPDDAKTEFLQQQAMQDVGTIYRFDSKEIEKASHEFEEFLASNQGWRKKLPEATFEEFYEYAESFEDFLLETRFSDERTIRKLQEADVVFDPYFLVPIQESDKFPAIPSPYWASVKDHIFQPEIRQTPMASYILEFFEKKEWILQKDLSLEKKLKQVAQDRIPQQYTLIKSGTMILEPGEKISVKHITMLQSMKNALASPHHLGAPLSVLGSFLLSLIITFLMGVYLNFYYKDVFYSLRRLALLSVVSVLTLVLSKAAEYLLLYKGYNLIEVIRYPLIVPFASLPLCVLLGPRIALFFSIFLSIIISFGLSIEYEPFLILNLIGSICTIMFSRNLHKRKDVFEVCGKVWICTIPVLFAFHLMANELGNINQITDLMSTFGCLTITAIIVVGLLPMFETLFKIMTEMTLMEFMDPNNELLRRLSLEAPGTYQHSLVVGNFAEVAARSIGANHLFCRVATLYHDVGKLFNPHYFTENQLGGFNIHQLLTPLESAHVIIAHVQEGEILGKKYHLPESFIDVIREHHGTTLVYFFYCKQIEQMGGDASKVNPKLFRYQGPKPRTKESALIMLADSIEAASRSLDEVTEESVTEMVDKLITEKSGEGQFDECPITFEELSTVKKAIVKALLVTRHLRVKYPAKP
ncbi:MAG: HDIG domain-containing protein [Rhabdochlamydiaceae bacterium]|nr:HDIG domain-containing protein [Rhabdochlamydiaceae bacterium]